MRVDDFDYELPPELIAQYPLRRRSASRMLVIERDSGALSHHRFAELPSFLEPGDCLVINDAKVSRARLLGRKEKSGGRVELLLLEQGEGEVWEALAAGKVRPSQRLELEGGLRGEIVEVLSPGRVRVRLHANRGSVSRALSREAHVPLPPYIRRPDEPLDRRRYQTVYAVAPGAVAAPTAGLHFTKGILDRLKQRGVAIASVTLRVGAATFEPLRVATVEEHRMGSERYSVPRVTAEAISLARVRGRRVIAVGTTVVRALESAAGGDGRVPAGEGSTDLFMRPGHCFRVVDALLTNFHLPRSTLLMLVCAFAGRELVLEAYRQAVERRYRFYSYGDCTLML